MKHRIPILAITTARIHVDPRGIDIKAKDMQKNALIKQQWLNTRVTNGLWFGDDKVITHRRFVPSAILCFDPEYRRGDEFPTAYPSFNFMTDGGLGRSPSKSTRPWSFIFFSTNRRPSKCSPSSLMISL